MLGLHRTGEACTLRQGADPIGIASVFGEERTGAVELGLPSIPEENRNVLPRQQQFIALTRGRFHDPQDAGGALQ